MKKAHGWLSVGFGGTLRWLSVAASGGFAAALGFDFEEVAAAFDDGFIDDVFAALALVGELVHEVEHDLLADGAQGPGAGVALEGALGDGFQSAGGELDVGAFQVEELLVLLDQGVLGAGEDVHQRGDVQWLEGGRQRKTSDKFRDKPVMNKILGFEILDRFLVTLFIGFDLGLKTKRFISKSLFDDLIQTDKRTAADK